METAALASTTSGAANVAPAPPAQQAAPAAPKAAEPQPAAQISAPPATTATVQSDLAQVLLQLDNLPQEQPNAPLTVSLEGKADALRQALAEVELGETGADVSGLILNASV